MFKRGKVFISLVAIILCSLLLTGCGKNKIEKFKEYLVEEAGYEEHLNGNTYFMEDEPLKYMIYFQENSIYEFTVNANNWHANGTFFIYESYVKYDFENNVGTHVNLENPFSESECVYNFELNQYDEFLSNCFDYDASKSKIIALKEKFDAYLVNAGIKRTDLLETEE